LDAAADAAAIAAHPAAAPAVAVFSDHLAYLNYTPGSTGKPKPVGLTHRGVERLALRTNYADLGPGESLVQGASISFDAATYEIWGCLLAGSTLVGLPREVTLSPPDLAVALDEYEVDNLFLTTALLHQVAREAPATFRHLKRVMFGGEAVEPVWIREILEKGAPGELFHFYGPTENTTYSTWHPVRRVPAGAATVPIGRAVAHSSVHAVDRSWRPVPVGVAGELWVGGDGLARGYLRRPAATAEKFVPDPFGPPGGRLYRTGDLVRWNREGALEFVGRFDNQVKLRGFRIELGEIEGALVEHPAVAGAVVLVREDVPGERRLVGYVATAPEAEAPTVPELREHLSGRLPKFMVPAALVVLDALPLTANGKVDRRALPVPELDRTDLAGELVAPRDRREALLAEVFAQVLRLDAVGVRDNFFELGGDSILSIQLVSRAKRAGLRLSPRQVFEHPTVAELAAAAELGTAVAAEQGPVAGPVPPTPIQRAFLAHDPETRDHFNMPLLLAPHGAALDPDLLEAALGKLVEHHDGLRLRLVEDDTGPRLEHAPPAPFVLERIDLSAAADPVAALEKAAGGIQAGLDLVAGPVFRAALFELGEGGQRLLLVPHHLVVDGVSWRILLEDLETAYRQSVAGAEVELPAKTTSFRAWAERLEAFARGPEVAAEAGYWLDEAARPAAPLALDEPGGDDSVAGTKTFTVGLDEEATGALLHEVPRAYRTQLQEVLLAAVALTLGAGAGGGVRVDLEGHGREEIFDDVDLSRTVGWFTTMYPVVLTAAGGDPGETLQAVKQQLRAVPAKGLGYGLLRHGAAEPETAEGLAAPATLSFNYLGQLDQALPEGALFEPATEPVGAAVHPARRREHPLQIDAQILGDRLSVDWSFSSGLLAAATVEGWARTFLEHLEGLIEHCLDPQAGKVTAGDFGLDDLGLEDFDDDDLMAALGQVGFGDP
ncbi:MAG: AMP-binding protein, partial [Acidobacteria bacterium]|nr:AMP-binding protein [Acidobacteriota bacterium]